MPRYSQRSLEKLNSCHVDIQKVFNEVIRWFDNKIIFGYRGKEEQDDLYYNDPPRTKLKYPHSNHNKAPSLAVDAVPYPVNWDDRERMTLFAGFVLGIGRKLGIELRWGGDWNSNFEVQDNSFDDLAHFELVTTDD